MWSSIDQVMDRAITALSMAAAAALAGITALYLFEITARYFFNAPTTWSNEIIKYLLAVVVFAMLPRITRDQGHVIIDIIPAIASPLWSKRLIIFSLLASVLATGIVGALGLLETMKQFDRNVMTNAVHPIPRWWITGFVSLGFIFTMLQFFSLLIKRKT